MGKGDDPKERDGGEADVEDACPAPKTRAIASRGLDYADDYGDLAIAAAFDVLNSDLPLEKGKLMVASVREKLRAKHLTERYGSVDADDGRVLRMRSRKRRREDDADGPHKR